MGFLQNGILGNGILEYGIVENWDFGIMVFVGKWDFGVNGIFWEMAF